MTKPLLEPSKPRSMASTSSAPACPKVERAFRSMKNARPGYPPIHHWLETRVRAHILLCMLAYYVEWHMREAWRALLFADEDLNPGRNATR